MNIITTHLYCLTTAFLTHAVVAQNVIFQDDFNIADTSSESVLTSPSLASGRGAGAKQDDIVYGFSGGTVGGVSVSSQKLAYSLSSDGNIRFYNASGGEYDFASDVGNHYEISYMAHGARSHPLTFSMSSEPQTGRYNASFDTAVQYDFGLRPWASDWTVGEDGNYLYDGNNVEDGFNARADTEYSVRIVFDERVDDLSTVGITETEASVYIDSALLGTYDIEFESDKRYMQFAARVNYDQTFDDLIISSYAIPELSNTAFIFSLFALSICLARRSLYRLRA